MPETVPAEALVAVPGPRSARLALALLVVLLAAWALPWGDVQQADGAVVTVDGPARGGAVAALGLVLLAGLALTALASSAPRGVRLGLALTDASLALLLTVLLLLDHPWIPGAGRRATWIPIFAPLAALALLDAGLMARLDRPGREVTAIRGSSALFAAAALAVDGAWLPAAVAGALAASPLSLLRVRTARGAGAVLAAGLLVASLVLVMAPTWNARLLGAPPLDAVLLGRYAWLVAGAVLWLLALLGLARRLRL